MAPGGLGYIVALVRVASKEVKNHEYRVAITPIGVRELVAHGHEVVIERDAGVGSQIPERESVAAGATIVDTAEDVGTDGGVDMVLKVKEPVAEEYGRMREGPGRCSPTCTWPRTSR